MATLPLRLRSTARLEHSESLDGDIRRIFASHDAKAIREGYGQLPAWFSRLPGQPRRRQVRSVFVSAGVDRLHGPDLRATCGNSPERPLAGRSPGHP